MHGRLSLRKLIKNFAGYISAKNEYSKDLEEQMEYALRITVFETLKVIGVIFVFSLFGHSVEAVVAVGTMAIIKPFIGGYHEDTQIRCFAASLVIVASVIYLSINLNMDVISKLILSGASLFCIWNQAPVVHPKMAITKTELLKRNRIVGLFIAVLLITISIVIHRYNSISNPILWTIIFQTLLLFNKRSLL
jgi:accessory gene regulator B